MRTLPYIAVFALLLAWEPVQAQRVQDWVELGDEAMANRDPYGGMRYYAKALELDSNRGTLNYKYAESLRANHRYAEAARYFRNVYERDYGNLFPQAGMHLAEMLKQSGAYEASKKIWRQVRDQHASAPEGYAYRKAVQEMRAADLAVRWTEQPPPFQLESPGEGINLEDSEYAGRYGNDGEFVFTAMRGQYDSEARLLSPPEEYYSRIYIMKDSAAPIEVRYPELKEAHGNYAVAPWGEVYLTLQSNGRSSIHLYDAGEFRRVLPVSDSDTSNHTHPAPVEHNGEKMLYFSSDRPGGYGGYDLWVISLDDSGMQPTNLGSEINTPGNEITPFFRSDENRLYFSSDWHHGLGGYDIFYSEGKADGFRQPQNLLPPFNSPANDLYYTFNTETGVGSITSNRVEKGREAEASCCNDLWKFTEVVMREADTIPEIETLEDLNAYLPVTLYFHNDEPDPRTTSDTTHLDYPETYYRYLDLLPLYEEEYSAGLAGNEANTAEETIDRFFLDEVDKGMADLEFFTALLHRELDEGHRIDVSVRGYASPLARTDYNVHLANRRIVSLINYFKGYRSGALIPYFENKADTGGVLRVVAVPFGEYASHPLVSDNPNERDAVYGIGAARERRIQIVSVGRARTDSTLAEVVFDEELIDLGALRPGEVRDFSFRFSVVGNTAWTTDTLSVESQGLAGLATDTTSGTHPPGSVGTWSGILEAGTIPGKFSTTLTLFGNLPGERRELILTYEIRDRD